MKRLLQVVFILSSIIFLYQCSSNNYKEGENRGYIVKVGDMAPNFTINTIEGKSMKLSELYGKVIMLQFTASWCGVCRKEMPFIEEEIWQEYKNNHFVLIGIDRDESLEKVKKFSKKMKITYPLALDPKADIFGLYANKKAGVTRNVIINKEGKIVYLTRLFNREEFDKMKDKIKVSLDE